MSNDRRTVALNISTNMEKCYGQELAIEYQGNDIVCVNKIYEDDELDWLESFISKLQRYKDKLDDFYCQKNVNRIKGTNVAIKMSHVYLMLNERDGFYKIGRSLNPEFRERTLQAEAPKIIKVFTSPLTYAINEKRLHLLFKDKRIRGEWFSLNAEDISVIKNFDYSVSKK